jgi:hypothetical protein
VRRLVLCLVLLAPAATASAQDLYRRPRFHVALGMGASFDRDVTPDPRHPLVSYFFGAGLGDGLLGLDLRSFANGATKTQVTRLSLELVGVVRPLATIARPGYPFRVLRTLGADLGAGTERTSLAEKAAWRTGAILGAHLDVPLEPAWAPAELRLRLGLRRMLGSDAHIDAATVPDTTLELYGQLAFVF